MSTPSGECTIDSFVNGMRHEKAMEIRDAIPSQITTQAGE